MYTAYSRCGLVPPFSFFVRLQDVANQGHPLKATVDHIIAKSKGGPSHFDNYQILCMSCNGQKADNLHILQQGDVELCEKDCCFHVSQAHQASN